MKAPSFWYRPAGWQAAILAPFSWIWALATRRRLARGARLDVGVPVVCIGNISAGGTGKTPTVIALAEHLRAQGVAVHIVSRGHGGALQGPLQVSPTGHTAAQVGDEPLLLSAFAPTWIARDRAAGAAAAVAAGAQLILLDDGFQNPALAYRLSVVVVDAGVLFGNGRVLPAGPLREPVAVGLSRADHLLLLGPREDRARALGGIAFGGPISGAEIQPLRTGMSWAGTRVFAFAGIGRPDKFFDTLRGLGADVIATERFADHAPYRADLLRRLAAEAARLKAQLVTTEKDAVRLPPGFRAQVITVPVRLTFDDDGALLARVQSLAETPKE